MLSIFLDMEITLAKKNNYKYFFLYFEIFLFILFVTFFQSCYLISHIQKLFTLSEEQNKKRIMKIG